MRGKLAIPMCGLALTIALGVPAAVQAAPGHPAPAPVPELGSAARATASSWPSQVARPGPASCPRGERLIAPTSGWTDALGVAHLVYRAAPGLVANIPPRGLTAGQVTPAVLSDLGAKAARPASPAREERLARLFAGLARDRTAPEFCHASPAGVSASRLRSGSALPDTHTDGPTGTWAGYAVTESEFGGGINGVTGTWSVPANSGTPPDAESTWTGIGGNIGGEQHGWGLIQAGTEMAFTDVSGQLNGYYTFFQYAGSNTCQTVCGPYSPPDAISPGQEVSVEVWWDSSTAATFVVTTPNLAANFDMTISPGVTYDHTSAEWVNEDHPGFTYDKPGTVQFYGQGLTGSFGGAGSFNSPFEGSYEALIMVTSTSVKATNCSSGNGVISYPAYPGNSSGGGSSDVITCPNP
jgi:hypothetical protein